MNKKADVLSGHTFLMSLVTDHSTFADEIDKFHYLKSLKRTMNASGCSGISFVLTDDVLFLILFTKAKDIRPDKKILASFHQTFIPYYRDRYPKRAAVNAETEILALEGDQLLEETLRLHMLPKRQGTVQWASDYFWSSAKTYLGHYNWDFIEQDLLLSLISTDRTRGRREFNRCARIRFAEEFGNEFGYNR